MSLTRRRPRFGVRDAIAIALVTATAVFAIFWLKGGTRQQWVSTRGEVIDCRMELSHYNAPDYQQKVTVIYGYDVGGARLSGTWTGLWPDAGSPDALPPNQLSKLMRSGHPLHVYYATSNPAQSRLHEPGSVHSLLFGWLAIVSLALTAVYTFRIYPLLRFASP